MNLSSDLDHFPETDFRCEGCHAYAKSECVCPNDFDGVTSSVPASAQAGSARSTKPALFTAGDRVVYRPHAGAHEEGTVTSVNDSYVFVCYGLPGSTSKATRPEDLEHVRSIRRSA